MFENRQIAAIEGKCRRFVDCEILPNVERLTVLRIVDQFGRKTCQKKRKNVIHQLLFKNILLYMNGRQSKIRSVHMYVITRTFYFD